MGEMRFEDENNEFGSPPQVAAGFDISGKLVSWGLVSSRQQAEFALVSVAVLVCIVAALFFFRSSRGDFAPPPPPNMAPAGVN